MLKVATGPLQDFTFSETAEMNKVEIKYLDIEKDKMLLIVC